VSSEWTPERVGLFIQVCDETGFHETARLIRWQREMIKRLREDKRRLQRLASFFRSVIKCGEPWTTKCQEEFDAAMGGDDGDAA